MNPTVSELMHIIPHNLLSNERMWAHSWCTHIPPSQEQVPHDKVHEGCRDELVRGLGHRLPFNYGCWIVVFVWCNYLTILYRILLYINDVILVSVPWVITCVRLDLSTLGDDSRPDLVPLKPRCDSWISCFACLLSAPYVEIAYALGHSSNLFV